MRKNYGLVAVLLLSGFSYGLFGLNTASSQIVSGFEQFSITVEESADTLPDSFSFAPSLVSPGTVATSAPATLSGFNGAIPVSVSGDPSALYSLDGNAFTAAPGTVTPGQQVWVRGTASPLEGQSRTITLSAGDGTAGFTITSADLTPVPFAFTSATGAAISALTTSNSVTISGINTSAAVSVSGDGSPQVRVGTGLWTTGPTTIISGQTLAVRLTSSAAATTTHTATVTVGNGSATYSVTTQGIDPVMLGPSLSEVAWLMATHTSFAASRSWGATAAVTGTSSITNGRSNTAAAAAANPGGAADYCQNLVAHGYDDWYLPAAAEVVKLRSISNINRWSSTQHPTTTTSAYYDMSGMTGGAVKTGTAASNTKTTSYTAHCVRSYLPAISGADPCLTTTVAGTICSDGSVYGTTYNGWRLIVTGLEHQASLTTMNTGGTTLPLTLTQNNGVTNTPILLADARNFPQPSYCDNLVAHGKSDWYLPSILELDALRIPYDGTNAWIHGMAAFPIEGTAFNIWSSSGGTSTTFKNPTAKSIRGTGTASGMTAGHIVRCMRRG